MAWPILRPNVARYPAHSMMTSNGEAPCCRDAVLVSHGRAYPSVQESDAGKGVSAAKNPMHKGQKKPQADGKKKK